MDIIDRFMEQIELFRTTSDVLAFIETKLLLIVFIGLTFGFIVLLVEMRLPLKYYWELPFHLFGRLFQSLRLRPRPNVWGRCIEESTRRPVPLTVVELFSQEKHEPVGFTFSNRKGEYGFVAPPGKYSVRAIKNHYLRPPFFDPENIRLESVDESFATKVYVLEGQDPEGEDLILKPIQEFNLKKPMHLFTFYLSTFVLSLSNGLLAVSIIGSWYGWVVLKTPLYAILMAVGIILMFVKIYILETVGSATAEKK